MGKLERFERKQRVKKMKEAQAAERAIKQERSRKAAAAFWKGIVRYRDWAASRKTSRGRVFAFSAPALLLLVLIVASSMSTTVEPETSVPKVAEIEPVETLPTTVASEPVGEKVKVVKTGLDFQDIYEGERFEESDGTFRVVVKIDEGCPGVGRRDYEFRYSLETKLFTETVKDIDNCLGQNAVYRGDPEPLEVEADGTIKVDALDTDGTVIVDDSIVISSVN